MNEKLKEQYQKETGWEADSSGYPTIGYTQWLEAKVLAQQQGQPEFSRQDMIAFANTVYKSLADLPGHEPDDKALDEWLSEQIKL